jgi:hypothetical protein
VIRGLTFAALAGVAFGYSFWVYLRAELPVPHARSMAVLRSLALVMVLALLFDLRVPGSGPAGQTGRWVLLDASTSMSAGPGADVWREARDRAEALAADGWTLVTFAGGTGGVGGEIPDEPNGYETVLAPALRRAAEAGASEVRVLSDLRFQDPVAIRAALDELPIDVSFEAFGAAPINAGVASFELPDAEGPGAPLVAEVEIHATGTDSVTVELRGDGGLLATRRVAAPAAGLRRTVSIDFPAPDASDRVRYTAVVRAPGDDFTEDDEVVRYATVGHADGAVVLISFSPDWEPRFLLPALAEATGLRPDGYLRAGADRFVRMGRALARGGTADSATVRRAATDAELLVLHGIGGDSDGWARALASRRGRMILLPLDADGARLAGVRSAAPRAGEWYVSGDLPASPLAGELTGAELPGLPPLSDILVPSAPKPVRTPLRVQLRGTGPPEAVFQLTELGRGRVAVGLASGFWRWAAREGAPRDAYRRLWSGLAGWLLADAPVATAEARPTRWVFDRGEPVEWSLPGDSLPVRLVVRAEDSTFVDSILTPGARASIGRLPPGSYAYRAQREGDTVSGRFDVATATLEMSAEPAMPEPGPGAAVRSAVAGGAGRPLRTSPWPYLFVIVLLCGEWIWRRRSGLR